MTRLSPAELGLHPRVYAALVWVRDALDPETRDVVLPDWLELEMFTWVRTGGPSTCGTAACIGGIMELWLLGQVGESDASRPGDDSGDWRPSWVRLGARRALHDLFYGFPTHDRADRSPAAAAAAIGRVLVGETSDPWRTGTDPLAF